MYLITDHPLLKRKVSKVYTSKKTGTQFVYDQDNKSVSIKDLVALGIDFKLSEIRPTTTTKSSARVSSKVDGLIDKLVDALVDDSGNVKVNSKVDDLIDDLVDALVDDLVETKTTPKPTFWERVKKLFKRA